MSVLTSSAVHRGGFMWSGGFARLDLLVEGGDKAARPKQASYATEKELINHGQR